MRAKYAEPSRSLAKIWGRWIDLHKQLQQEGCQTAAPFFSAASSEKCSRRILFFGKATNQDWDINSYEAARGRSKDAVIRNRLKSNRDFVSGGGINSAFWSFFSRLARFDPDLGSDSVVWSNIAKIGSRSHNPDPGLLDAQSELATETLRQEIREYKPALTVFVTGSFANGIINDALGTKDGLWSESRKADGDDDVWWLKTTSTFPDARFLWTRHPQGKTRDKINFWVEKAEELLNS
jgi:hypothetical protein